jgi:hypothetical protein
MISSLYATPSNRQATAVSVGNATFATVAFKLQKQRNTAKEQRPFPLFFLLARPSSAQDFCAGRDIAADNFLEQQQKQREGLVVRRSRLVLGSTRMIQFSVIRHARPCCRGCPVPHTLQL